MGKAEDKFKYVLGYHVVLCGSCCSGLSIPYEKSKIKTYLEHNDTASTPAGKNNKNTEIICLCDILERMWQKC